MAVGRGTGRSSLAAWLRTLQRWVEAGLTQMPGLLLAAAHVITTCLELRLDRHLQAHALLAPFNAEATRGLLFRQSKWQMQSQDSIREQVGPPSVIAIH